MNKKLYKIYQFGIIHGLCYILFVLGLKLFPHTKITTLCRNLHNYAVKRFIRIKFKNILQQINNKHEYKLIENKQDSPIWFLWWQGDKNMPPIISACHKSIIKNSNGHPVIFISKDNIDKYITIPTCIINKVKNGMCSFTHLSDYIRFALLYYHGGIWIDSTVLLTSSLKINNFSFDTINTFPLETVPNKEGKWNIFYLALPKGNLISLFLIKVWEMYWTKYNKLIDYFFTDYCINVLYETNPYIQQVIDTGKQELGKFDSHSLLWLMNKEYNSKQYKEITQTVFLHKLKYKGNLQKTINNSISYYEYIISEH